MAAPRYNDFDEKADNGYMNLPQFPRGKVIPPSSAPSSRPSSQTNFNPRSNLKQIEEHDEKYDSFPRGDLRPFKPTEKPHIQPTQQTEVHLTNQHPIEVLAQEVSCSYPTRILPKWCYSSAIRYHSVKHPHSPPQQLESHQQESIPTKASIFHTVNDNSPLLIFTLPPRFLSQADIYSLPTELKELTGCPHLLGRSFTREFNAKHTFLPSKQQQMLRYSSSSSSIKPNAIPSWYNNPVQYTPGKFVIANTTCIKDYPNPAKRHELLNQLSCVYNSHSLATNRLVQQYNPTIFRPICPPSLSTQNQFKNPCLNAFLQEIRQFNASKQLHHLEFNSMSKMDFLHLFYKMWMYKVFRIVFNSYLSYEVSLILNTPVDPLASPFAKNLIRKEADIDDTVLFHPTSPPTPHTTDQVQHPTDTILFVNGMELLVRDNEFPLTTLAYQHMTKDVWNKSLCIHKSRREEKERGKDQEMTTQKSTVGQIISVLDGTSGITSHSTTGLKESKPEPNFNIFQQTTNNCLFYCDYRLGLFTCFNSRAWSAMLTQSPGSSSSSSPLVIEGSYRNLSSTQYASTLLSITEYSKQKLIRSRRNSSATPQPVPQQPSLFESGSIHARAVPPSAQPKTKVKEPKLHPLLPGSAATPASIYVGPDVDMSFFYVDRSTQQQEPPQPRPQLQSRSRPPPISQPYRSDSTRPAGSSAVEKIEPKQYHFESTQCPFIPLSMLLQTSRKFLRKTPLYAKRKALLQAHHGFLNIPMDELLAISKLSKDYRHNPMYSPPTTSTTAMSQSRPTSSASNSSTSSPSSQRATIPSHVDPPRKRADAGYKTSLPPIQHWLLQTSSRQLAKIAQHRAYTTYPPHDYIPNSDEDSSLVVDGVAIKTVFQDEDELLFAKAYKLNTSEKRAIYNEWLSLNRPYALQLYNYIKHISIYDVRLHPTRFKSDLETICKNKSKYLHHVEFDRDILGLYRDSDAPTWFSLSSADDSELYESMLFSNSFDPLNDTISLTYRTPRRFAWGYPSLYRPSDITMGPTNSATHSTVLAALRGEPVPLYCSQLYQHYASLEPRHSGGTWNKESTNPFFHRIFDPSGKYVSAMNAFSRSDIDTVSPQPHYDPTEPNAPPEKEAQYHFSLLPSPFQDDLTDACNIGRTASLMNAIVSNYKHKQYSQRQLLISRAIALPIQTDRFVTSAAPKNNTASEEDKNNGEEHKPHAPPLPTDWSILTLDPRSQPEKFLRDLNRCHQHCLVQQFPNMDIWNKWWFETKPQLALKRRIVASYIAANRYKIYKKHADVASTSNNQRNLNRGTLVNNPEFAAHQCDLVQHHSNHHHLIQTTPTPTVPNSDASLMGLVDACFEDEYSGSVQIDGDFITPARQPYRTSQSNLIDTSDSSGGVPSVTPSHSLIPSRIIRPHFPITPKEFSSCKKKLYPVFSTINVYKGDTINQLPICLHLTQILHASPLTWSFHGDPALLVQPPLQPDEGFLGSFFRKIF